MKRRIKLALLLAVPIAMLALFIWSASASADWRWAAPKLKPQTIHYSCSTMECITQAFAKEKKRYKKRVVRYDKRRLQEWKHWSRLYIPQCTWYGESGTSSQFARVRYTMPNSGGSGAYGKYQMMPGTYFSRAKYGDWSPLDQEIAGHRLFWDQRTSPWTNCR
jgi:hypothetical protein